MSIVEQSPDEVSFRKDSLFLASSVFVKRPRRLIEVHYLVEDAVSAVQILQTKGCRVLVEPFDIAIGKCAVIEDPFGTRLCILDMTKGTT